MDTDQKNKIPASIRKRIAWTSAGLASWSPLLRASQRRYSFIRTNFLYLAIGLVKAWDGTRAEGFYLPLTLNWFSLIPQTQIGNTKRILENSISISNATQSSVLRLNFLFMQNVRAEHFFSQSLTNMRADSGQHLLNQHDSSVCGRVIGASGQSMPFGKEDQNQIPTIKINRKTLDVIWDKKQQINVFKPQSRALQARQLPRKEIPAFRYQTVNQVNAEQDFRSYQPISDELSIMSDRNRTNIANTLPVENTKANQAKMTAANMVDQLFDLGMESMPMSGFSLREFASEKNTSAQTAMVSTTSSTAQTSYANKPIKLDSGEITQIADRVSRLLQQRQRLERERKGGF